MKKFMVFFLTLAIAAFVFAGGGQPGSTTRIGNAPGPLGTVRDLV